MTSRTFMVLRLPLPTYAVKRKAARLPERLHRPTPTRRGRVLLTGHNLGAVSQSIAIASVLPRAFTGRDALRAV
jgi:hypothetical protein